MSKLTQRGDTIVEVLIAIAIVSSVLVGAYAAANKSLNTIRASQERSEAVEIAKGQVEKIEQFVHDQNLQDAPHAWPDCIVYDDVSHKYKGIGSPCSIDPRYNLSVTRLANPPDYTLNNSNLFQVQVTWQSINGRTDNVTYFYKIVGK